MIAGEPPAYRFGKGFPILFSVRNPSLTTVHIGYWTCSTYNNWKTDNADVRLARWPCFSNGIGDQEIPPGGTFTGEIGVFVSSRPIGTRVTFRIALISAQYDRTVPMADEVFWSNPTTLEIVE